MYIKNFEFLRWDVVMDNQGSINNISGEVTVKYPASEFSKWCFDILETVVQSFAIVLIVFTPFFRVMTVEGESMMNTLLHQDKIFVWRWNYTPTRGDVVTITHGQIFDKPIVKRIIATGGDTLSIDFTDGSVTVNGKVLDETYIKEPMWREEDGEIPAVVPMGYSFVMGDNRNNSTDSRSKLIGLIPDEDIIGKVSFIIFPFSRIGVVS